MSYSQHKDEIRLSTPIFFLFYLLAEIQIRIAMKVNISKDGRNVFTKPDTPTNLALKKTMKHRMIMFQPFFES